jgi:hypothetical protein
MKKIYLIFAAIGLVAITVSFVPAISKSAKPPTIKVVPNGIPDDIKAIFEKSCMGCHSDDAKGFAKSKVNFSKWDSYDAKKQADKAAAICNMVTKGKMPPKKVKAELKPTPEQITAICNWSQTVGK